MKLRTVFPIAVTLATVSQLSAESVKCSQVNPGNLDSTKIPLFINLGFDDNRYADGVDWVTQVLFKDRYNNAGKGNAATYDGTPMKCDFYVIANSDLPYPDVSGDPTGDDFYGVPIPAEEDRPVTDSWVRAYKAGFAVGNHTFTHNYNLSDLKYDQKVMGYPTLLEEIGHCSRYLVNVAGIPQSEIKGLRTPYLASSAADNASFKATRDLGILFDCTNDNGMQGNIQAEWALPYFPGTMENGWGPWTTSATEGLWQVPNAIYPTTETGTFSVKGFDSGTSNGWPAASSAQDFFNQMKWAIKWHYKKNRAPLDLGLHSDYYSEEADVTPGTGGNAAKVRVAERRKALVMLLDFIQDSLPDARVVTKMDIINWMRTPVTLDNLSRNEDLTYASEGESITLTAHSEVKDNNGSTVALASGVIGSQVTVVDAKDWKNNSSYAGLKFDLTGGITNYRFMKITYASTLPLNIRLDQDDAGDKSHVYGLPASKESRTVIVPICKEYFMQPRPLASADEKVLDRSKVSSISVVGTAFDSTVSGNFRVEELKLFVGDKATSAVTKTAVSAGNGIAVVGVAKSALSLSVVRSGNYTIELFGLNGQRLISKNANLTAGVSSVDLGSFGAGSAILRVSGENCSLSQRIVR